MLKEKGAQHEKSCEKGLFEVVSLLFLITLMSHGVYLFPDPGYHSNLARGLDVSCDFPLSALSYLILSYLRQHLNLLSGDKSKKRLGKIPKKQKAFRWILKKQTAKKPWGGVLVTLGKK